jgi:hypothetical protein
MTAREQWVRLALRRQLHASVWAPEVCPHGRYGVCAHAVVTRLRRPDRLDRTAVVITPAATAAALTIQHP